MAYGTTIGDVLREWEYFGIFRYLLPFLIIFAIIYGILDKTKLLGKNKGVNATIALSAGLLSLMNNYVPDFFERLFPYAGMGIAILLIALILMGLVSGDDNKWHYKVWFGIGIIIFIAVVLTSLSDMTWLGGGGYMWRDAWPSIVAGIIVLALVSFIIFGDRKSSSTTSTKS
jgi:hypothetical protein